MKELTYNEMWEEFNKLMPEIVVSDTRNCIVCGKTFNPTNDRPSRKQKYCSLKCNYTVLLTRGKQFSSTNQPTIKPKIIYIDLLEGLSNEVKETIKFYVSKGFSPLGFTVDTKTNNIYYFGKNIVEAVI